MMKQKLFALCGVFVIGWFLAAGCKPTEPTNPTQWTQILLDDPGNTAVHTLATFQGKLYASTTDSKTGLDLWRLEEGGIWKKVADTGFGTPELSMLKDMVVYQGKLYAAAGDFDQRASGQLWRSVDGSTWEPVTKDGFGNIDTYSVNNLAIFKNMIYAITSSSTGLSIWRSKSGDAGTWEKVIKNNNGGNLGLNLFTDDIIEFKGALYLSPQGIGASWFQTPFQVWRSLDGVTWEVVTQDGFGDTGNVSSGKFAIFKDQLYMGAWHFDGTNHVAELWRSKDGVQWEKVMTGGFGDWHNLRSHSLVIFGGQLYVGTWAGDWKTGKLESGAQVWRSPDGEHWTQVNSSGFDDPMNWIAETVTVYQNSLYYGTGNDKGGQIWKLSE
jgi:hypothetical protein